MGKDLVVLTGPDAGVYVITEVINAASVRVVGGFSSSVSGLSWVLRDQGFRSSDVGKTIHIYDATSASDRGSFKISAVIDRTHVRLLKGTFAGTEYVTWELRDYVTLSDLQTLGMYDAYRCREPSENTPAEALDTQQIFNVAVGP